MTSPNVLVTWLSRAGVPALLAASLVTGAATAASAAPDPVVVKVAASDLGTPAALRTLVLRLRVAAERACGVDRIPIAVRFSDGFRACREDAIDRAVAALNIPQLADALGRSPEQLASARR